jgi:phosphoglycolate phosphatase-like HAD superfamily hydrolase
MAAARPRLRAVVFDFDGVILESGDLKTEAFVELFADHPAAIVAAIRTHHLANLGVSRFVKFDWIHRELLGRPLDPAGRAALGERFAALVLDKVLGCPFVPGALDALDALAPAMPLFVASGTPQAELDTIVERRDLRTRFRETWGSPREKPAILRDLLARHALTPGELLFVGDGTTDHDAAREVGVAFVARDTAPMRDEWRRRGVRRVDDLRGLAAAVAAW